jgi:hypothetical protein
MELAKPRPPYVTFEKKVEEDRADYVIGQPMKFKDVDYAYVTPVGSKDRIERRVEDWFPQLVQQIREGRFEQSWYDAYKASYEAWKADQEPPINGTPIGAWPVLSLAQVKNLKNLRILAVEDLAAANEETLVRVGMGARALRDQAVAWLKAQETGGNAALVKRLTALEGQLAATLARNELLEKANTEMKQELAKQPA